MHLGTSCHTLGGRLVAHFNLVWGNATSLIVPGFPFFAKREPLEAWLAPTEAVTTGPVEMFNLDYLSVGHSNPH